MTMDEVERRWGAFEKTGVYMWAYKGNRTATYQGNRVIMLDGPQLFLGQHLIARTGDTLDQARSRADKHKASVSVLSKGVTDFPGPAAVYVEGGRITKVLLYRGEFP